MHVAFVLLPEAARPDPDAIAAAYAALFPERTPLVPSGEEDDGDAVSLSTDDGTAHALLVSEPVPGGEAERNAGRSLAAVGQEPGAFEHAAHLVVPWSPAPGQTIAEGLRSQARVTAAVALATGAVGVYVGAAGATHPAEWYVGVARQVDDPVMLWLGVSHAVVGDDEAAEAPRHSFLSFGMHQFGQPDLLLTAPLADGSDAIEYFYDLLGACGASGRAIEAGETVGRTAEERLAVRYEPNPVDEEMVVFCVDL